jgi:hypothetical protein
MEAAIIDDVAVEESSSRFQEGHQVILEDNSTSINSSFELPTGITDNPKSKKKGRPVIHGFVGRITLLREEVELALNDGPAFIEMMNTSHPLSDDRWMQLVADGHVSEDVTDLFFTFRGDIADVLKEVSEGMKRWETRASNMRIDFKKQKLNPEENPARDGSGVIQSVAVYPNRIYGYLRVTYKKIGLL